MSAWAADSLPDLEPVHVKTIQKAHRLAAKVTVHSVEVMLRRYRKVSEEDRVTAVAQARQGSFVKKGEVIEGSWAAQTGS